MDIGRNGLADVLALSGSNQITENYNYEAQTGLLAGQVFVRGTVAMVHWPQPCSIVRIPAANSNWCDWGTVL